MKNTFNRIQILHCMQLCVDKQSVRLMMFIIPYYANKIAHSTYVFVVGAIVLNTASVQMHVPF